MIHCDSNAQSEVTKTRSVSRIEERNSGSTTCSAGQLRPSQLSDHDIPGIGAFILQELQAIRSSQGRLEKELFKMSQEIFKDTPSQGSMPSIPYFLHTAAEQALIPRSGVSVTPRRAFSAPPVRTADLLLSEMSRLRADDEISSSIQVPAERQPQDHPICHADSTKSRWRGVQFQRTSAYEYVPMPWADEDLDGQSAGMSALRSFKSLGAHSGSHRSRNSSQALSFSTEQTAKDSKHHRHDAYSHFTESQLLDSRSEAEWFPDTSFDVQDDDIRAFGYTRQSVMLRHSGVPEGESSEWTSAAHAYDMLNRLKVTRQCVSQEKLEDALAATKAVWPGTVRMQGVYRDGISDGTASSVLKTIRVKSPLQIMAGSTSGASYGSCVIHPSSPLRTVIDIMSMLMLAYDMLIVPYVIAWSVKTEGVLYYCAWITAAFWSMDMIFNFFTGYYTIAGELVVTRKDIARHYVKGWFAADVCLVSIDWVCLLTSVLSSYSARSSPRMARILRFSRLVRLISLFRVARFRVFLERCTQYFFSGVGHVILRVSTIVAVMLSTLHIMACSWYAVASIHSDTGVNWLQGTVDSEGERMSYAQASEVYQYTTAFHFAMTQMTPGSMQVHAVNSAERIFTIVSLFVGMIFFSQTISLMSTAMMQYRNKTSQTRTQLSLLCQFLRENNISSSLSVMLQKQVRLRLESQKPLSPIDIPALSKISMTLHADLQKELCGMHVMQHPLLQLCAAVDTGLFHRLCNRGMDYVTLCAAENLFLASTEATSAYYVVRGAMKYIQEPVSSMVTKRTEQSFGSRSWISEAALFTEWHHVGVVEATSDCGLVQLNVDLISKGLASSRAVSGIAFEYAWQFTACVQSSMPPKAAWPTDLEVPFTEHGEIMVAMPLSSRMLLSRIALQALASTTAITRESMKELKLEVKAGGSTLVPKPGGVQRIVILSTLELVDFDGRIFVQIGKSKGGEVIPACVTLGTKMCEGEVPMDALDRLLEVKLSKLAACVKVTGSEVRRTVTFTEANGLDTKYIRVVHRARLNLGQGVPEMEIARSNDKAYSDAFVLRYDPRHEPKTPRKSSKGKRGMGSRITKCMAFENPFLLCAWMTPVEFAHFGAEVGRGNLRKWISHLEIKGSTLQAECALLVTSSKFGVQGALANKEDTHDESVVAAKKPAVKSIQQMNASGKSCPSGITVLTPPAEEYGTSCGSSHSLGAMQRDSSRFTL